MRFFKRKNKLEKFYYKNKEFIDYSFVSFICTIILYSLYFLITWLTKGRYVLANFVAYFVSFTILFMWNQKIFKSKPRKKKDKFYQLIMFIFFRGIGFLMDSLILISLIERFEFSYGVSKLISSLIMFVFNYATNKLFIFKKVRLI